MKVKIDECLPHKCAELIVQTGYDAKTVYEEGLQGAADREIWRITQREKRFLITTDLDFSDIRHYTPGKHAGILLIRLTKEGKARMLSYLKWLLSEHNIEEWKGCLVIATDHKIRIKVPNFK